MSCTAIYQSYLKEQNWKDWKMRITCAYFVQHNVHMKGLKQALSHGSKKVPTVIEFNEKAWLKPHRIEKKSQK